MIRRNRVVITGLGILAANGIGKEAFWKTLLAGESGIAPVTLFDASELPCQIAGEVKNFDPLDFMDAHMKPHRMARFAQFAVAATKLAVDDSGITDFSPYPSLPVFMGVSTSATDVIEDQVLRIARRGVKGASPFTAITSLPQAAVGAINKSLGINTQTKTFSTGCAAGLDAIAAAYSHVYNGKSDIALAGGADASITLLTMATFNAARMLPAQGCSPSKASRPFDLNRTGGLLAEGAGMVVLESMEHAVSRNAQIYLEITGYGFMEDDAKAEAASGLKASMLQALQNQNKQLKAIDYICAHGCSDIELDKIETKLIKEVFGQWAHDIPISSIKGVTGNPLAAAGPMQLIACALASTHGLIPPTANYEIHDPDCDLDYVPKVPRKARFNHAIINNHGMGGSNSSLTVKPVES